MKAVKKSRLKIAVVANTSWYIFNFRLNLLQILRKEGHDLVVIAPTDKYAHRLEVQGFSCRHLPLDGSGTNPLSELRSLLTLRRILHLEKVDLILSYTPKGNIYAGLAILGCQTRIVANISGLGRVFVKRNWLTLLARVLYRFALGRAFWVFFQNEDDRQIFTADRIVDHKKTERIPGSGVDLSHFLPIEGGIRAELDAPVFLLVARMLWDKGVGEFVEAARIIRMYNPAIRFQLLGYLDDANTSAVPREKVEEWVNVGLIEYLGTADDIRPYLGSSDCVVLPSYYREGVPRSLLEAAAMAKPIITTNSTGCRDTVDDNVTGFLCQPRDAHDLSDKMLLFLHMTKEDRQAMGLRGREKMIGEFDEKYVLDCYIEVIDKLLNHE